MALEEPLRGPIDDIEKKMRVLAKPMRTRACAERGDDGAAVDDDDDGGGGDAGITKLKRNWNEIAKICWLIRKNLVKLRQWGKQAN